MTQRSALVVSRAASEGDCVDSVLRRFAFTTIDSAAGVAEAIDRLGRMHYDLLLVPLGGIAPGELAELERELRRERHTFVIGTGPHAEPELLLRAMRSGIHEFVVDPPDVHELGAAVERLMRRVPVELRRGEIIAVHSGKGGLGATSIAVNLAHGFARNHARSRVALVDLDVADGNVRVLLNVNSPYDLGSLAAKLDQIDGELLDSLLVLTPSGLWVLPAPESPDFDDTLDAQATAAILDHLRGHFAFTVLDCEHHLSERTLAAMDAADRIVIVTQLDVAALKSTQKTLTICRRLGYPEDKLCVLVNRYTPGGIIGRRDAAKVLGRDVYYALPNAYQLSSAALTRGVPVAAVDVDADLSRDFLRLAAKLGGSSASDVLAPANASRLGRLFHRKWRV